MAENFDERPIPVPRSAFNLIFLCVLSLTLICLVGCFFSSFWLASHKEAASLAKMNARDAADILEDVSKLTEVLRYSFSLGCGAVIGLIGGKGIK